AEADGGHDVVDFRLAPPAGRQQGERGQDQGGPHPAGTSKPHLVLLEMLRTARVLRTNPCNIPNGRERCQSTSPRPTLTKTAGPARDSRPSRASPPPRGRSAGP